MGHKRVITVLATLAIGCGSAHERPDLMGDVVEIVAKGLHTDPNARAVPEGALLQADNVVIRSPGLIEPRRGFEKFGVDATGKVHFVQHFEDSYIYAAITGSTRTWRNPTGGGSTVIVDESGNGFPWGSVEELDAVKAAGNLYFTSASGVRRISDPSDGTAYRAGLPAAPGFRYPDLDNNSDANLWLADGDAVAYRILFMRKVNGREIRGAPSGPIGVKNDSGGARRVALELIIPEYIEAGDYIEVYRTRSITGEWTNAGDELSLVKAQEITSSNVTSAFVLVYDEVNNDDRGAALYTNATQQGILQANGRPPKASALAVHNSMTLYGKAQRPHAIDIELLRAGSASLGVGEYNTTGDFSSGSPTISNVASFSGVEVGMYITDSTFGPLSDGTHIPAGTKISGFDSGAGTITMDANALASGVTQSFRSVDWIAFGSSVYYADDSGTSTRLVDFDSGIRGAVADLAAAVGHMNNANLDGDPYLVDSLSTPDTPGAFYVYTDEVPGTQFAVTGTKADAWSPKLATSGTDVQSTSEDRPGRVFYSKPDQPEHVPYANHFDVGNSEEPILRMVSLRDVTLIFKTDGIYRLSGRTPETLRLDPLDTDTVLIHPHAVDVLDNVAFAWTNRGIVQVTASGVRDAPISSPIASDIIGVQETQLREILDTSSWGDTSGIWIRCNTNRKECYVGAGSLGVYVFNVYTGAWTHWDLPGDLDTAAMADVDPLNDALVLHGSDSGGDTRLYRERTDADRTIYADDQGSGDVAVTTTVEWHPFSGGAWHRDKFWRECILYLESAADVDQVDWTFYDADRQSSASFFVAGTNVSTERNRQVRVSVPREATRGPSLGVKVSVDDLYARYGISVLRCSYEPMADRLESTL